VWAVRSSGRPPIVSLVAVGLAVATLAGGLQGGIEKREQDSADRHQLRGSQAGILVEGP